MKRSLLLLCFLVLPLTVSAQGAKTPDPQKFPVLQRLKEAAKDLAYDYMGRKEGFDVWLISGSGVVQTIYVPVGGKAAIVGGTLVDPNGQEVSSALQLEFAQKNKARAKEIISGMSNKPQAPEEKSAATSDEKAEKPQEDVSAAVPTPTVPPLAEVPDNAPATPSEIFWQKLSNVGFVRFPGKVETPVVYAILDPNDPVSKDIWKNFEPLITERVIDLRIVPLAITAIEGIMQSAQVLGSQDPQQVWRDLMAGKSKGPVSPDPNGVMAMKSNIELAQEFQLHELPFIIYRKTGADGSTTVRILRGQPKNWDKTLEEIGVGVVPAPEKGVKAAETPKS